MFFFLVFFSLLLAVSVTNRVAEMDGDDSNGTAFYLSKYPLAMCLDGTAGAYTFRAGLETERFLIFHEGGGACESISDCTSRANTTLGSSAGYYPAAQGMAPLPHIYGVVEPYFHRDPVSNPLFHNWTHIYVHYCDGGLYASDRLEPIIGDNKTKLYFRGRYISEALIDDLQTNHGLGEATDVVIGGCSAGGLHVIAHIDAVAALLPPTARVVGYSDSGFPMVCTDPSACMDRDQFLTAESGQNGSHLLNPRCLAAESKPGKCLRADALGKYAETPIFLSQSTYDLANLRDPIVVDPSCEAHPECVNMFGDNMSHVIRSTLLSPKASGNKFHAGFLDSCARHCQFGVHPVWMPPVVDGVTPMQAVHKWYTSFGLQDGMDDSRSPSPQLLWAQDKPYPCLHCCNTTT